MLVHIPGFQKEIEYIYFLTITFDLSIYAMGPGDLTISNYSGGSMAQTQMVLSPGLARTIIIVLTGLFMHNPPWMAGTTLG